MRFIIDADDGAKAMPNCEYIRFDSNLIELWETNGSQVWLTIAYESVKWRKLSLIGSGIKTVCGYPPIFSATRVAPFSLASQLSAVDRRAY